MIVRDADGNTALYAPVMVTTLAQGAPTPGTNVTFINLTKSSFQVNWGAATAAEGGPLQYKVVRAATSAQIDSIAEIEAVTGNAASDWLDDQTSFQFTGLDLGTNYSVAVLVKDSFSHKAIYSPLTGNTLAKFLFITNAPVSANFGSASAADNSCNADAGKPAGGGTYKAVIGATWRVACNTANCQGGASEHTDWPLQANTPYGRPDGAFLGKTNAVGLLPDTLSAKIKNASDTYAWIAWSGFDREWRTTAGVNCSDWGSNSSLGIGTIIYSTAASTWRVSDSMTDNCNNTTRKLICAEQ